MEYIASETMGCNTMGSENRRSRILGSLSLTTVQHCIHAGTGILDLNCVRSLKAEAKIEKGKVEECSGSRKLFPSLEDGLVHSARNDAMSSLI
jgi:hypothetical protein